MRDGGSVSMHRFWRTKLSHLAERARDRALEHSCGCLCAREFRFDAELDEVGAREVYENLRSLSETPLLVGGGKGALTVDTVPVMIWCPEPRTPGPQIFVSVMLPSRSEVTHPVPRNRSPALRALVLNFHS
jgi:hypothetical protein